MRALLLGAALALSAPAVGQDHSGHGAHGDPAQPPHQHEPAEPAGSPVEESSRPEPNHRPATAEVDHSTMDHAARGHGAPVHSGAAHQTHGQTAAESPSASPPPPRAFSGPDHAADLLYDEAAMARARQTLAREHGGLATGMLMVDRLEARLGKGEDLYVWEAQGRYGGDIDRLWLKSEGEGAFGEDVENAEIQALWGHAIGPWFDLQAGVRYDFEPESRAHAVLGLQGLAPYMFEVDGAAFVSDRGDLTGRVEAEYDQRITQRLILQPRAEVEMAAQAVPERALGAGITSVEVGLRLRYQVVGEFAPYLGLGYEAKLGRTADLARAQGEDTDRLSLLLGLRGWF